MSDLELLNKASCTKNNLQQIQLEYQKMLSKFKEWEMKNPGGLKENSPSSVFSLTELTKIVLFIARYIVKLESEIESLRNQLAKHTAE
jgi:hypothetical protein